MRKLLLSSVVLASMASVFVNAYGQNPTSGGAKKTATPASATASQAEAPHKVALIDMGRVFKEYKKIEVLKEDWKSEFQVNEDNAKKLTAQVQQVIEQMKEFKQGSPEFIKLEKQQTDLAAKLGAFKQTAQRELLRKGVSARDMAEGWDSAWIDFSKGLGAPIGGVIAGSSDFIDEVWRWKQRMGGSMRQAGVCAAACVYALDHHVDRLADDHANARALARGLSQIDGIEVQQPETNLVFFKPDGAGVAGDKMVEALRKRGVLLAMMDGRIRACTHLDVSAAMIEETVGIVREIVRGA